MTITIWGADPIGGTIGAIVSITAPTNEPVAESLADTTLGIGSK